MMHGGRLHLYWRISLVVVGAQPGTGRLTSAGRMRRSPLCG
ncbi:hypothetical protein [Actinomadura sp. HBU206391]|nr:hypothetical protein [Actinomadura sp. HBU206391]